MYVFTVRWASRSLSNLWPSAMARSVARTAWATASIGTALAALAYSGGAYSGGAYSGEGFADFRDAVLEVAVSSWPLLVIPRWGQRPNEAQPAVLIERSWIVISIAAVVYVVFVATLGRGL